MSGLRWSVFRDDHLVGRLVEPIWEDMFWHSYRVIGPRERPLDPRVDITSASFWCDIEALSYVNLVLGVRAPHAFPASIHLATVASGRAASTWSAIVAIERSDQRIDRDHHLRRTGP